MPSRRWWVAAAGLALLAGLILFREQIPPLLQALGQWVESLGTWGPVAFMLCLGLGILVFAPAGPFYLLGGVLFGLLWGGIYAFVGVSLGGAVAFLLSRTVLRDRLAARMRGLERLQALDQAMKEEKLRFVALVRLSPILPSSVIHYGLGATSVRLRHYLLAAPVALPGVMLYVFAGDAMGKVSALAGGGEGVQAAGPAYWVLLGAGILATALVTWLLARRARGILATLETTDGKPGGAGAAD